MKTKTRKAAAFAARDSMDLSLADALVQLRRDSEQLPPKAMPYVRDWAEKRRGVEPDEMQEWIARAWWGRAASQAVASRDRSDRAEEVLAITDVIGVEPVRARWKEAGRGLLLSTAHVGPFRAMRPAIESSLGKVCLLGAGEFKGSDAADHKGDSNGERAAVYVEAVSTLLAGGIAGGAADGHFGRRTAKVTLQGKAVTLHTGHAHLAAQTKAVSYPCGARWRGDRIVVEFGPPLPELTGESDDDFEQRWVDAYALWLDERLRAEPENLGLRGGVWERDAGILA